MRDVRTIILAAVSRRDLCYVSENEGFRFCHQGVFCAAKMLFFVNSPPGAGCERTPFAIKGTLFYRKGCANASNPHWKYSQ